jgi:ammonia channel protein AmtB
MFTALKKLKLLLVSRDEELYGLDIALHKTLAYPEDMMEEK